MDIHKYFDFDIYCLSFDWCRHWIVVPLIAIEPFPPKTLPKSNLLKSPQETQDLKKTKIITSNPSNPSYNLQVSLIRGPQERQVSTVQERNWSNVHWCPFWGNDDSLGCFLGRYSCHLDAKSIITMTIISYLFITASKSSEIEKLENIWPDKMTTP
jgi:hypothetical protein